MKVPVTVTSSVAVAGIRFQYPLSNTEFSLETHGFLDLGPCRHMLPSVRRLGQIVIITSILLGTSSLPRAEEELLRGPHPFVKENQVSIHTGYSLGMGDNAQGMRVQGDYTYRLSQRVWLDIQMGLVPGTCKTRETVCTKGSGDAVDILGGAAWKFQTNLPIVPYARLNLGTIFLFPDHSHSAWGLLMRGSAGAHYFLYDWFGLGAEIGASVGKVYYSAGERTSAGVGSLDANLGVALQF